ncbi:hypothetical protein OKW41_004107 [Paraburkholderia sp. UCT70]
MRGFLLALACACVLSAAAAQDLLPGAAPGAPVAATDFLALANRVVDAASRPAAPWKGPRNGPPAQSGKHIAVVAEDLRNGGILGVVDGVCWRRPR